MLVSKSEAYHINMVIIGYLFHIYNSKKLFSSLDPLIRNHNQFFFIH